MSSSADQESDVEREVLRLEEELRRAEMQADVAALDRTYADDVMVTTPFGVVDKQAVMAEFHLIASKAAAGEAKLETFNKENIKARAYGDTAVTSYRVNATGQYEGRELSQQFQITNVWMKREGRWQIVARHSASIEQTRVEQAGA